MYAKVFRFGPYNPFVTIHPLYYSCIDLPIHYSNKTNGASCVAKGRSLRLMHVHVAM